MNVVEEQEFSTLYHSKNYTCKEKYEIGQSLAMWVWGGGGLTLKASFI